MWLLAVEVMLLSIYTSARAAEGCSGFQHLENGRTFFRYSGLFVIFRCHPGYKLHGYKTNSCVSGHWSRDPPVCVGSGCSHPGPLTHGTSSMNEDGSWAVFSCNSGFRLLGPSMLYCKGHNWNSTKPVCKEFDMMSSVSGVSAEKAAAVLKTQQQSHYDTVANTHSKEANLKLGLVLSHTPPQRSNSQRIKDTNPKVHLQQHVQFPSFKVKGAAHREARLQETNEAQGLETGTGIPGTEATAPDENSKREDEVTQMSPAGSNLSTTVSSTSSLVSATERPLSSPPSISTAQTPTVTGLKHAFPTVVRFGRPVRFQEYVTPSAVVTSSSETAGEDQQAVTGVQYPLSFGSVVKEEPRETLASTSSPASSPLSFSSPAPSLSASTSSSPGSTTQSNIQMPNVTSTTNMSRSQRTELRNLLTNTTSTPLMLFPSVSRRPVCPYPPVPPHGTFYFRNVENPGPGVYRHYIQYACYPGYTLAHGDVHSFCQEGATWSGITPVCLELTPCSVNNGGCSQLCSHAHHLNQSSHQTQLRAQCHCRPGFTLLDDGQTCRDLDECADGQHQCHQRCINTFGSFKCGCDDGHEPAPDQTSCLDIDECAVNQGLGPCMQLCHNSPGSYRCSCTYGHILSGDGHSCVPECPPGYSKQPTTPENSTAQALNEGCVDINECQEQRCEWQCVNLPGSHRCICPRGYTLHRDGKRCQDINECSRRNGGCSHLCLNQRGGYKCACPPPHRLSPYSWKKCVPRATATTAG
ncbi:uncharacterized protein si:dkey-163f14.6 [Hippoglossus stenolepis]|uniref:uncharacterized protein si:dkey-163f14.6 n=1 Tax=Hippoglossus stenolepis TaxID=195615 RepID=UPI001FB007EF|nr:uncharacterized protein si:dkey-163f14.6 [Hippoglossus stenolepis]